METHGSDEGHDEEKLTRFLTKEMKSGLILDGTVTSEPGKMQVPKYLVITYSHTFHIIINKIRTYMNFCKVNLLTCRECL